MTVEPLDVLLIESDPAAAGAVLAALPPKWRCEMLPATEPAEEVLDARTVKVLLCSDDLPGETGLMFLARTKDRWPKLRRILLAPDLDGELFFHAMREVSLFDYLTKPVVPSELMTAVSRARAQFHAAERLAPAEHGSHVVPTLPVPDPASVPAPAKPAWPRDGALLALGCFIGSVLTLAALALLYLFKTEAGVDLFPLHHLRDIF
jgi:DNA-binding NarL/FixJ family response regulator